MHTKINQVVLVFVAVFAATSSAISTKIQSKTGKSDNNGIDICQLGPIKAGHENACNARRVVFTFDATEGRCVKFTYGGCFGTQNIFRTRQQCENRCLLKPQVVQETSEDNENIVEVPPEEIISFKNVIGDAAILNKPNESIGKSDNNEIDICQLGPIKEGHENACNARRVVFTFDAKEGRCVKFTYGGCFGTRNIFRTRQQCENRCLLKPQVVQETNESNENIVEVPINEENFFKNVDEVKDTAIVNTAPTESIDDYTNYNDTEDICLLEPIQKGQENVCFARIQVYTFDSASGLCVKFIYGGCFGSRNLFRSRKHCEQKCHHLMMKSAESEVSETSEPSDQVNSAEDVVLINRAAFEENFGEIMFKGDNTDVANNEEGINSSK